MVGLREGTLLQVEGDKLYLKGRTGMRLFRHNNEPKEVFSGEDIDFLLEPLN